MTDSRMLSLNNVSSDFSIEELEPRMEMQMLGMGANPAIDICIRFGWLKLCLTYIHSSVSISIGPGGIYIYTAYTR